MDIITRDGTPATGSVNGGDSFTMSLTTTHSGALILLGVGNSSSAVTGVTPTATGLTFVQVGTNQTAQSGSCQLYRAFAPGILSSLTITCTANVLGQFPQLTGWVVGYYGTDTSGTNGSGAVEANGGTSNAGSNGLSQAVTTLSAQALVIAFVELNNTTTIVLPATETKVIGVTNVGNFNQVALIENIGLTGIPQSITMSYTLGGSNIPDALIVASIKPARPSFTQKTLRPRPFAPGNAR